MVDGTDRDSLYEAIDETIRRNLDEALRAAGIIVPEQQYQGPLPPPALLKAFEDAVPGLAGKIVEMAVSEQRHRHAWERRALTNDIFAESGGLFMGWALAIFCAGLAGLLAWNGNNVGAGLMLSVVAGAIIKTIVNGRSVPAPDKPELKSPPTAPETPASASPTAPDVLPEHLRSCKARR